MQEVDKQFSIKCQRVFYTLWAIRSLLSLLYSFAAAHAIGNT